MPRVLRSHMDYSAAFSLIEKYIHAMESSKPEALIELFTVDGTVDSPVCGLKPAQQFYHDWLKETKSVRVTVLNKFINPENPCSIALHLILHMTLARNNDDVSFPVVDVFDLNDASDKIKKLNILFDKTKLIPSSSHK